MWSHFYCGLKAANLRKFCCVVFISKFRTDVINFGFGIINFNIVAIFSLIYTTKENPPMTMTGEFWQLAYYHSYIPFYYCQSDSVHHCLLIWYSPISRVVWNKLFSLFAFFSKLYSRWVTRNFDNPVDRQITYSKPKDGIIKKATKLSVLCDSDVGLLMFSPNGRLID